LLNVEWFERAYIYDARVIDMHGRVIDATVATWGEQRCMLYLPSVPDGVYVVELRGKGGLVLQKKVVIVGE
jgi:hypothetical protein